MSIRRILLRGITDSALVVALISSLILLQSLLRIPALYTSVVYTLILLACSLVLEHSARVRVEIILSIAWVVVVSWYTPRQATLVLLVYLTVRFVGQLSSLFLSQTDKTFALLLKYMFCSLLLTIGYTLLFDMNYYALGLASCIVLVVQWLLFRRYNMLGSGEL